MAPSPVKGYAKLEQLDVDDDVDPTRSFKDCPSDQVVWPEYQASCLSRLFFSWFDPLVTVRRAPRPLFSLLPVLGY